MENELSVSPIGVLRSCFSEKFGVPRQPGMVSEARGILKLRPDPGFRTALNRIDGFSHLWLVFVFHESFGKSWRPTIQPPRVGAPRVGVFASRSPHRPNPIGISAVKLERVDLDAPGGIELHLGGVDLLDGTPVLDIKPYLPFADSIPEADAGWAKGTIPRYRVEYSEAALRAISASPRPRFQELLTEMLEWDPRPTSQRESMPIGAPEVEGKCFAFRLFEFDVRWQVRSGAIHVTELVS